MIPHLYTSRYTAHRQLISVGQVTTGYSNHTIQTLHKPQGQCPLTNVLSRVGINHGPPELQVWHNATRPTVPYHSATCESGNISLKVWDSFSDWWLDKCASVEHKAQRISALKRSFLKPKSFNVTLLGSTCCTTTGWSCITSDWFWDGSGKLKMTGLSLFEDCPKMRLYLEFSPRWHNFSYV